MWVLPVDRAQIPRAALPPGRYLLPWYLTLDEVARTADLLAAVLAGVTHHAMVPSTVLPRLARAPLPDGATSALVVVVSEGEDPGPVEEALEKLACRYTFVQWPTPRDLGYGWLEQHVKGPVRSAITRELRSPEHPLSALNVAVVPVMTAATLTPDPLELVDLVAGVIAHRLASAEEAITKEDYLRSLMVVAGQRLVARLSRLPEEALRPALDVLAKGRDGPLGDARTLGGAEALQRVGLASVAGGAVALGPLARATEHAEVRAVLVAGLPAEAWSLESLVAMRPPAAAGLEALAASPGCGLDDVLFTWIHLGDIHMGAGDAALGWDQRLVQEELRRDIASMVREACPDAILVTGDVARSGRPEEYERAQAWLHAVCEAATVPPDRVFLVPGNHDVDRSSRKEAAHLVAAVRDGAVSLDDALRHDRGLLLSRQQHFLRFAEPFGAGAEPFWVRRVEMRGLAVRLVGLDTALVSADDSDHGKLRVGHEQLAAGLGEAGPGELVMVLSHHPLHGGWLADEAEARRWIHGRADLHLHAHVHETVSEVARGGSSHHAVTIAAGASYPARPSHGYSIGQIIRRPEALPAVRVWPRRWSDYHHVFRADVDLLPEGTLHLEHLLLAPRLLG